MDSIRDRQEAIKSALAEYVSSGSTRTLEIEYKSRMVPVPVVRITSHIPLLNHNNARLNAQLKDHLDRQMVESDPFSDQSQQILAGLLRGTRQFKDLKNQIQELSQREPGLITRDGLLINGNTRVVALRDLGVSGVDVAVLPEGVNAEDLLEIEMSLQMTRLIRQDYTFTNELLLMDRYIKASHTVQQLATKMGWTRNGKKKVEQRLRILSIIEEVRNLSDTDLPYSVFDTKEEHLKDLDKEYQSLKDSGDLDAAEKMKWSRVAAIFLGANKDQVRTVNDDFFEDVIEKRIEDNPEAKSALEAVRTVRTGNDELEKLLGPSTGDNEQLDLKKFVKQMLNDPNARNEEGGIARDLPPAYAGMAQGVRLATEQTIKEEKFKSYLVEPATVLRNIQLDIRGILEKYGEVSSESGFDLGKFQYELNQVGKALEELEKLAKKTKP